MAAYDDLMALLEEHKMVLDRSRKHQIWKHPDGRSFTMSSTPSDTHAVHQQIRSLRKFLGIARPKLHRNTERREKRTNHQHVPLSSLTASTVTAKPTWQGQLAEVAKELSQPKPKPVTVVVEQPKPKGKDFTPDVWEALKRHGVKIVSQS